MSITRVSGCVPGEGRLSREERIRIERGCVVLLSSVQGTVGEEFLAGCNFAERFDVSPRRRSTFSDALLRGNEDEFARAFAPTWLEGPER